jgi:hypothetical protein
MTEQKVQGLPMAQIISWPDGYAAVIAGRYGLIRCCAGHETPDEAATHGIKITKALLRDSVKKWTYVGEYD